MITYNHEKFIAQAIGSVMMQLVNFDYELVIGEDCSTDNTRAIVIDFHQRYPDRIRVLLHDQNQGLRGQNNFVQTLKACQGQYVAILEGDDYWTCPDKLQKQVDYLDRQPDSAICFHNAIAFYEDGSYPQREICLPNQMEKSTIEDLLLSDFIPTCSIMFRRDKFLGFPDWVQRLGQSDWPLEVMIAQHGFIRYIDEVMAAYRVHPGGIWSSLSPINNVLQKIEFYTNINDYLNHEYDKLITGILSHLYFQAAHEHEQAGDLRSARACAASSIKYYRFTSQQDLRQMAKISARLFAPRIYNVAKMILPLQARYKDRERDQSQVTR
jgi:glycosyltransferase involved in cell wall biosynthesis